MVDRPQPDEPPDEGEDRGEGAIGPGGSGSGLPGLPGLPGFENIDLEQLMRILQSPGPVNWEVAGQVATYVTTEGATERAVDAATTTQLQELAHAAQTHVVAQTGLTATFVAPVRTLVRREWAELHLTVLRPVLEKLATTLGGALRGPDAHGDEPVGPGADPFGALLPMLAPLLLGVQAGSMVGYLAQHALGRYDLPLPTNDEPALGFVVPNIDEFEEAWSLERADLRFYVALHEVVHAAERSVPWVRERLVDLATEYVSAYDVDPTILEARLGGIDPNDPESLQRIAEQPEELLGAMQSDRQREVLERARVFHAVLEGYADAVLERIGTNLIPSFARIHEAMERHRIERGEAARFVEGLLGLTLEREDYERGAAFCAGVEDRAGTDGLNRLWGRPETVPTPNELEAPGLWLARIDLPEPDA